MSTITEDERVYRVKLTDFDFTASVSAGEAAPVSGSLELSECGEFAHALLRSASRQANAMLCILATLAPDLLPELTKSKYPAYLNLKNAGEIAAPTRRVPSEKHYMLGAIEAPSRLREEIAIYYIFKWCLRKQTRGADLRALLRVSQLRPELLSLLEVVIAISVPQMLLAWAVHHPLVAQEQAVRTLLLHGTAQQLRALLKINAPRPTTIDGYSYWHFLALKSKKLLRHNKLVDGWKNVLADHQLLGDTNVRALPAETLRELEQNYLDFVNAH